LRTRHVADGLTETVADAAPELAFPLNALGLLATHNILQLVTAIENGGYHQAMIARLNELEQQKRDVEARPEIYQTICQTYIPISGRSTAPESIAWPPRSMTRRLPLRKLGYRWLRG
jgi:hypothetical protein